LYGVVTVELALVSEENNGHDLINWQLSKCCIAVIIWKKRRRLKLDLNVKQHGNVQYVHDNIETAHVAFNDQTDQSTALNTTRLNGVRLLVHQRGWGNRIILHWSVFLWWEYL